MPAWLPTVIAIFAIILLLDAVGSFILWRYSRNKLFLVAGVAWTANFINFAVHAAASQYDELTLLGHSFFYITSCALTYILCYVSEQKLNLKKLSLFGQAALGLSLVTFIFSRSYFWSALILDLAIAAPLIFFSVKALGLKKIEPVIKVFSIFLIINAIHYLDYPFLYNSPNGSFVGFSFAFFLCVIESVLLPMLIRQLSAAKYSQKLESLVMDRTQKLAERTEQLERINKDNVLLLSLVCHDISNPIMLANLNLEYLIDTTTSIDPKEHQKLVKVKNCLDAVTDIVDKARTFHASKLGKIQPVIQAVNVVQLVREVTAMFQLSCEQKNVKICFDVTDETEIIALLDPVLFKNQVLANLISNSIKFSEPGQQIHVELSKNGDAIMLEIIDQGKGIEQVRLVNLFDINKATTSLGSRAEVGTGLGLPTAKIMTEKMGGQISVSSFTETHDTNPKGTTFSLHFKSAELPQEPSFKN